MEKTELMIIVVVCITVIFVVSLITECIKQRSRDRYMIEMYEAEAEKNKTGVKTIAPKFEYRNLKNDTGLSGQKRE